MASNMRVTNVRTVRNSRSAEYEAFDKLPKVLRQALREANHPWSSVRLWGSARKRGLNAQQTADAIRAEEAKIAARYYLNMEDGFREDI